MNAVLTEDGTITLPPALRDDAQIKPGDTFDVQFYKGSIVLRKCQRLTVEECAVLLERSRSQPDPTSESEGAVEDAIRAVRASRPPPSPGRPTRLHRRPR